MELVASERAMDVLILEKFADALKAKFSLPGAASPEDQLKPVVADLLKSSGTTYKLIVETRTETHLSEHKVPSGMRLEFCDAISSNLKLPDHAARSIG
jgi:hypothetical protein